MANASGTIGLVTGEPTAVFGRPPRGVPVAAATLPSGVFDGFGVPVLPCWLPSGVGVGVETDSGAFSKTASALSQSPSLSTSTSWEAGSASS